MAIDSVGNLYVAEYSNHAIRRISPDGFVETIAGNGEAGYAEGIGTQAQLDKPFDVAVGPGDIVYVADNNNRIRRIPITHETSTFAGTGETGSVDGYRTDAALEPVALTFDSTGNLYFLNFGGLLRKISPDGIVSTLAGKDEHGYADGQGEKARFNYPHDIVADAAGNIYVADTDNVVIRHVTPEGVVTTIAGEPGQPGQPGGNDGFTYR